MYKFSRGFRTSKSWRPREDDGKTRIQERRTFRESRILSAASDFPALMPKIQHIRHVSRRSARSCEVARWRQRVSPSGSFSLKPPRSSSSHRSGPVSQTRFNVWVLFALAACHQSCSFAADRNKKEVKEKVKSECEEDDVPSC